MKRNDNILSEKWSQPRIIRNDLTPYKSKPLDCSNLPDKCDGSQAKECDINFILNRFKKTGVLPGVNKQAVFADVSQSVTYHDALNIILNAENQFNSLDAYTRKKFGNDPAEFLEFVHDPKNAQELIQMGLATQAPEDPTDRIVGAIKASQPTSVSSPKAAAGSRKPSDE